ncbi:cell division protein FtsQ/DivIB [Algirhabdus cladophorae]|uniref:cell division protein FtsQ/DivIB n=1 Tax=Algirhabdus cladophorae TaxID=3377108 RepID=UPI003B8493B7
MRKVKSPDVANPRRDPAPSRAAYRAQRLWLTPSFRRFTRYGVPLLITGAIIGAFWADEGNRAAVQMQVADIRNAIETRDEFMVKLMGIEGASDPVAAEIRTILPIDFPISSFDLNLEDMRQKITALDAVREAKLRVRSGGVLEISVTERVPATVWQTREGLVLLDDTGAKVVPLEVRSDRPELPLIGGTGADGHMLEALQLFAAARPVSDRVIGLVRVGERRWDLVLDEQQRILLPVDRPVAALERVLTLHAAQDLLSRDVSVVDMRLGRRPTVRLNENAVETLRQIKSIQLQGAQ